MYSNAFECMYLYDIGVVLDMEYIFTPLYKNHGEL